MIDLRKLLQRIKAIFRNKTLASGSRDPKINNPINPKIMTMFNYGVGGNEVKVDTNEAIQEIQQNKTLLVSKLTTEEPTSPEIVKDLKTIADVFNYFKPVVAIRHDTADGDAVNEDFTFQNLGDFTPKNLVQNSEFLNNLSLAQKQYNTIIRQLRNNKVLQNMLANPEAKAEFIETLKSVVSELEGQQ